MFALFALLACTGALADPAAKLGEPAPDFSLTDLEGNTVRLADFAGKTVVLEWFNPGCPYVEYAHGSGPLADLAAKWTEQQVVWLAINSGAEGKQGHGLEVNKEAAASWKMGHPILLDPAGEVGRLYGAKTTPQMVLIDASGAVRYLGALDNAPLGRVEGAVVPYLDDAVRAVLSDKPVQPDHTKPYGCSVKY